MKAKDDFKTVNLAVLQEISEGNNDLMHDLIDMFTKQVPVFYEQFDYYLEHEDYPSLGKLAHKIKNSVAMMGIETLVNDMKKLEKLAKSGNKQKESYISLINRFKTISAEAIEELNTL